MTNLFVVLDGIDGVGKTTVAKFLEKQYGFTYYKTPPGVFSEFRGSVNNCNSVAARFSFYLLALHQASIEIAELLEKGPVVCDRYTASAFAYHLAKDKSVKQICCPEDIYFYLDILEPNYNFLLHVDSKERDRRLKQKSGLHGVIVSSRKKLGFVVNSRYLDSVSQQFVSLIEPLGLDLIDTNNKKVESVVKDILVAINMEPKVSITA